MGDKTKNSLIAAILGFCWTFMIWWLFISSGGILGVIVTTFMAAIVGGAAYAVVTFLT